MRSRVVIQTVLDGYSESQEVEFLWVCKVPDSAHTTRRSREEVLPL